MKKIGRLKTFASSEITKSYMSIGFEGLDRDLFKPEKCYDPLGKTGIKYARCQTGWAKCETRKGEYDFTWLDTIIDSLLERGVIPWFNVGYGNPIYMPDAPNSTAVGCVPLYYGSEVVEAWSKFIEAVAKRYKGKVAHYEIWNEPDLAHFWHPNQPSGKEYASLLNMTADIILKEIPDAKIGACVSTPYHFEFIDEVFANVEKGKVHFFSYHLYSTKPDHNYSTIVSRLRSSLDKHGFEDVELWHGEAGYPSWAYKNHWLVKDGCDDERPQAVWQLRRTFLDIYNGIKLSSFYQMADMWEKPYEKAVEVIDKPAAHGILRGREYTPKKSYETISYLSAVFSGDIQPSKAYMQVDIDGGCTLEQLSCQAMAFSKVNTPVYAYYLPLELGKNHDTSDYKVQISVENKIDDPVVIDMYTGEVFEVENFSSAIYKGLFIRDYPLMLTERSAFDILSE